MIYQHRLKTDEYDSAISFEEMLPTMYDLPSENPEEPGVPDQFHTWQSELLTQTFIPPSHDPEHIMTASDMNLYYDVNRLGSYKRPDWYAVLDVPHLYGKKLEPRLSYVVWQEKAVPFIVVELLSPSTEDEDLGRTHRKPDEPPTKWEVYEQILGIPYYAVFSRYTDKFRAFRLVSGIYYEMVLPDRRMWIPELNIGLGLWSGKYHISERKWLRWYDARKNWIPTSAEWAEQERQRAEQARQRAEQEKQQAEQERQQAEQERQRAELLQQQLENEREQTRRLLELLKASGIEEK
ncbi:MAG: Uma2 family endonuclease [Desulfobacterales bacterium]|nr:Uma2 family endonuclease [Desulfobacterales bacterium]